MIWSVSDGKPGHDNQALGLCRAIESLAPATVYRLPAAGLLRSFFDLVRRRTNIGRDLPDPDLIIGVGHRTHSSVMAIRAARGGRAVVLMRPTLPAALFDLVIVPRHDAAGPRHNIIPTRGVLTPMQPASNPQPDQGLILIGGPSRHVHWSDEQIVNQILEIAAEERDVRWELTTSRRTPEPTLRRLLELDLPNLAVTPFAHTSPGWVAERLDECSRAWVSADSVSMVYEALTAGAAVGVLEVAQKKHSRVRAGLDELVRDGLVTTYSMWTQTRGLPPPPTRINEAVRCAEYILDRWFADRVDGTPARGHVKPADEKRTTSTNE